MNFSLLKKGEIYNCKSFLETISFNPNKDKLFFDCDFLNIHNGIINNKDPARLLDITRSYVFYYFTDGKIIKSNKKFCIIEIDDVKFIFYEGKNG